MWRAASLYTPPIETIAKELRDGLKDYFSECTVKVVQCPDLSTWGNVASKGICGNPKLVEVGGVPYITHQVDETNQKKVFSIPNILQTCNNSIKLNKNTLVFGAAAASSKLFPKNAELIPNTNVNDKGKSSINNTRYAEIDDLHNPVVGMYNSLDVGSLSNLYFCDGHNNDKVLYIRCKKRLTKTNFTNAIRAVLTNRILNKLDDKDASKQIGLGGVIKILKGKIRCHVMSRYANYCVPREKGKTWQHFYDVGPDLAMFSYLITDDPTPNKSLHLRLEHTHFYALDGTHQGGHYHDDVTPDIIDYEGYFNIAHSIHRIDDAVVNMNSLKKSKL
eukprot:516717_1